MPAVLALYISELRTWPPCWGAAAPDARALMGSSPRALIAGDSHLQCFSLRKAAPLSSNFFSLKRFSEVKSQAAAPVQLSSATNCAARLAEDLLCVCVGHLHEREAWPARVPGLSAHLSLSLYGSLNPRGAPRRKPAVPYGALLWGEQGEPKG